MDELLLQMPVYKRHLLLLSLSLSNIADAVEVTSIGFLLSSLSHNNKNNTPDNTISSSGLFYASQGEKELLGSSVIVGLLIGGVALGALADKMGRKPSLQLALCITLMANLLASISPNISFLIAMRLLGGLGVGGVLPIVYTFGAELVASSERDAMMASITSFWVVGSLFSAILAYLIFTQTSFNWRVYQALCSLPSLLAFLSTHLLVESPLYYIQIHQYEKAKASLTYLSPHAEIPSQTLLELDSSPINSSSSSRSPSSPSTLTTIRSFISSSYSLPLCILSCIWFTQHFSTFGMATWISSLYFDLGIANPYFASILFAVAVIPGNLFSIFFMHSLGRRNLLFWGMILSAASLLGFAFSTSSQILVIISSLLYNLFLITGWNGLCCLSTDGYFETSVKSSAMGFMSAAGRVGGILAQVINCIVLTCTAYLKSSPDSSHSSCTDTWRLMSGFSLELLAC